MISSSLFTPNEIRDPIYGFITVNDWEKEIINHVAFQRLRRIKQLGVTEFVYPSASHSRFEHSLGVMHYVSLMFDSIISKPKNKKILEEQLKYNEDGLGKMRQIIRIAALLHDIGHPPFSHSLGNILPINKINNKRYKHEDYSKAIIEGPLKKVIEENSYNKRNYKIITDEICQLILSSSEIVGPEIFWKVLISGQVDADRGDYLLRDSHHLGVRYGIYDHMRLINTLALGIDPESSDVILGISEDGWHTAESLIIARYHMFTQVNLHKTRRAYDYHIIKAVEKILSEDKIPTPSEIESYLRLDDDRIWTEIQSSTSSEYPALFERKHIRCVFESSETPTEENIEDIKWFEETFKKNEIWYHMDSVAENWYDPTEEIMIMPSDKDNSETIRGPLSLYSPIIKNMKEIKKIRIYVKIENKKEALEVIDGRKGSL